MNKKHNFNSFGEVEIVRGVPEIEGCSKESFDENIADSEPKDFISSKIALDAEETASAISLGRNVTYRLLQAGILPSVRFGSRYIVPVDSLRRALNSMVGQEVHL